jgi:hypothetical protein
MFPRTESVLLLVMGDDGWILEEVTSEHDVTDFAIAFWWMYGVPTIEGKEITKIIMNTDWTYGISNDLYLWIVFLNFPHLRMSLLIVRIDLFS